MHVETAVLPCLAVMTAPDSRGEWKSRRTAACGMHVPGRKSGGRQMAFSGLSGRRCRTRSMIMNEVGKDMSIQTQAEKIGFQIVGELTRCMGLEPSYLYRCYFDDASNKYILYRGILTIVAADGTVF